jgi:MHS family proline/betaine transporter-like MFS transporter
MTLGRDEEMPMPVSRTSVEGGLPAGGRASPDARRALVAASVGNAVEWYDFAIFGASAVVLARVFFPGADRNTGLVLAFAVFTTSFLARPVGALVIGTRADRLGRRRTLTATIAVMTAATVAIGLLPVPAAGGLLPAIFLIACRLVQGLASGGEISSSVPFVIEYAPAGRRGAYSGWHLAGIATGLAAGTATVAVISGHFSAAAVDAWAWRLPFLLAAPLGSVGLYLRLRLADTPHFLRTRSRVEGRLLADLLRLHRSACVRGFFAVVALMVPFNVWFIYLPNYLISQTGTPAEQSLGCVVLGLVAAIAAAPAAGRFSDRVGRRPVLVGATTAVCAFAIPGFLLAASGSVLLLAVSNVVVGAAIGAMVVPAFISEPFPTYLRATGVACTFGVASAVFGGTAPLVAAALTRAFPDVAVALYVVCAAALGVVAGLKAPETAFGVLSDGSSRAQPPEAGGAR